MTTRIEDQSTHTHMESLQDLSTLELPWLGHGLGTGAHSRAARTSDITSEGEGLLRQGIPEIGVLGVALFVAFAGAVIWGLVGKPGKLRVAGMVTDCRMWLAAPLMFELLRIPVDIAIRSFLASGLAWFFAGYFYARPPKGEPLLPAR